MENKLFAHARDLGHARFSLLLATWKPAHASRKAEPFFSKSFPSLQPFRVKAPARLSAHNILVHLVRPAQHARSVNPRHSGSHMLACSFCHRHSCLALQDSFVALLRSDWFPNTQLPVFHHQAARAQIFLVSLCLVERRHALLFMQCHRSKSHLFRYLSLPILSFALMIAQTWSFCEVACRILLACQHSSSLSSTTKQCFILKNRYAYARVSMIHPWYGVSALRNSRNGAMARAKKASNDDAYHQFSIT